MGRNYKRKTKDTWTKEVLLEALNCLKNGTLKMDDCAKQYKIPRATLYRHYSKFIGCGDEVNYLEKMKGVGGNPILTKVEEEVMKQTILDLREEGYKVTGADIKRICFEYCDSNGVPNRFREDKRMASDDWYYGFVKRNPEIQTSKPSSNVSEEDEDDVNDKSMEKIVKEKACPGKSPVALRNAKTGKKAGQKKPLKRLSKKKVQKRTRRYPPKDEVDEVGVQEKETAEAMDVEKINEENCEKEVDDDDQHVSEVDIDNNETCSELEETCESGPEPDPSENEQSNCAEEELEEEVDDEDVEDEAQTQEVEGERSDEDAATPGVGEVIIDADDSDDEDWILTVRILSNKWEGKVVRKMMMMK